MIYNELIFVLRGPISLELFFIKVTKDRNYALITGSPRVYVRFN